MGRHFRGLIRVVAVACLLALTAGIPQPCAVIYGLICDEYGYPYEADLDLTANRGTVECARGRVNGIKPGPVNYRLELDLDSGGNRYKPTAVRSGENLELKALRGVSELPLIPVSQVTVGSPGSLTRLDLFTGVDSDGDGIPDAWEQLLVDQSGGTLSSIEDVNPDDDFDGDGLSNWEEFLAGTFAFLPTDVLVIEDMTQLDGGVIRIRFLTSTGMSYRLILTESLTEPYWRPTPFAREDDGETSYQQIVGDGTFQTVYVRSALSRGVLRLAVN